MTKWWREEPPWLKFAKDLKPGGSKRVGDSLKLSFNGFSYHLFDFREKISEAYRPTLTLEQRLAMVKQRSDAERKLAMAAEVPEGCTYHPRDWPADARLWLYQSHLNDDDLQRLGFCWHADMQRVVLPFLLLRGGKAWVARDPWWSRKAQRPKYLRPVNTPGAGLYIPEGARGAASVVLTEDLLSAIRISEVAGLPTVPLMGTSLERTDALRIAKQYDNVLLWLDPDGAGGMGQMAVRKVLNTFDLRVSGFDRFGGTPKQDPKKLEDGDILKVVEGFVYG